MYVRNPPVSSCSARSASRWATRSSSVSTGPYSIVQFDGMPSRWASRWTVSHSSPESLRSAIVARAAGENTSAPPPGSESTPASFIARSDSLNARQMRNFNRGECLNHDSGVALFQAAKHVCVVRQLQLGMQPTDDVELARRILARRVRLGEHVLEAARVGAVFLRHARERAEDAGVAQDADVGRIDVLVRREVDAIPVPGAVREIGEPADRQQVVRCEKREAILARQPLSPLDLLRDESQTHGALRIASVTLCPPKPNELERATSNRRFTALFGAESRSQAGSGLNWLIVGGMTPFWSAGVRTPAFTAAVSAASPCGVDVPCALM